MYTFLLLLFLGAAFVLANSGLQKGSRGKTVGGVLLGTATLLFFWFLGFWGEALWFDSLGYAPRFWKVFGVRLGLALGGAAAGWTLVLLLTASLSKERRFARFASRAVGALVAAIWGYGVWDRLLLFLNSEPTDVADPIFGRTTDFYLFHLPFYRSLYSVLVFLALVAGAGLVAGSFFRMRNQEPELVIPGSAEAPPKSTYRSFYTTGAFALIVLGWGAWLSRFEIMYSRLGAVTGAGWTDVHVRMPAYLLLVAAAAVLALLTAIRPFRRRLMAPLDRFALNSGALRFLAPFAAVAILAVIWVVAASWVPRLFQWLRVEPNEITFEEPYIAHNIEFTRRGFGLHDLEEREFPASEEFSRSLMEENQALFSNIRLWDWRALDSVYQQFQEIRLYYEFEDVDVDRYQIDGQYRQVMISAREMQLANLPAQSQTFINRRFKYTHGYGVTLTPVNEFTSNGLPNLLIKDIPPVSATDSLKVERPEIYYGELTDSYVVANSEEEEFDYPRGEANAYTHYTGKGGVQIDGLWRKFLFGWKFGGTRLFLSGYADSDSRILFRRQIKNRVRAVAPFLEFDDDPYVVLVEGKLYWIIDAYTVSAHYPYSEPFVSNEFVQRSMRDPGRLPTQPAQRGFRGINYIRNSVKVVVDAFEGSADFYVFEPEDPIVRAWSNIFPELFKKREEMPPELEKHVRYPADLLLIQGLVYAKYHMTDPAVFYNQEDLWVRATEKYYNQIQPVEPYYVVWEPPSTNRPQFVLMLPFTPKNRQVMIGWIAGMCDPPNYGRFLAYKFPKDKRILGPQQVETKIDQDRHLSGQLTLWNQRGSSVIRGNVLAIPVEDTLLYVEPIYLQAETAAYPELRLVAVMHNDELSYAPTLEEALEGLLSEGAPAARLPGGETALAPLTRQAQQAYGDYLRYTGEKRFTEAAQALQRLEDALNRLAETTGFTEEDDAPESEPAP